MNTKSHADTYRNLAWNANKDLGNKKIESLKQKVKEIYEGVKENNEWRPK